MGEFFYDCRMLCFVVIVMDLDVTVVVGRSIDSGGCSGTIFVACRVCVVVCFRVQNICLFVQYKCA